MPFPSTSVLDNFNRANGGPPASASWSPLYTAEADGFEVITNEAAPNSNATDNSDYWNPTTFGPDSEAFLTAVVGDTGGEMGVFVRVQGITSDGIFDCYAILPDFSASPDSWIIYRSDNGAFTQLGAALSSTNVGAGDGIGLEVIGNSLQGYRKPSGGSWATIGTARSDTTYPGAGYIAMYGSRTVMRLDDFGGGTVVAAAVVWPLPGLVMSQAVSRAATY